MPAQFAHASNAAFTRRFAMLVGRSGTQAKGGVLVFYAGAAPTDFEQPDPAGKLATGLLASPCQTRRAMHAAGSWQAVASREGIIQSFRVFDNGGMCVIQGSVSDVSGVGDMLVDAIEVKPGQRLRVISLA